MHTPILSRYVCLINVWVVQDASVLSKAAMLHGMGALPSLAGLKPGQGRGQTDGAVSDSPIAPGSPLIAAKIPFSQVSVTVLKPDGHYPCVALLLLLS